MKTVFVIKDAVRDTDPVFRVTIEFTIGRDPAGTTDSGNLDLK